ncbi:hypothetical protein J6590_006466 [Homalodisca vitripennis]|nr:hypothetical protein J6590_006466 [Homalodisca vitripennis]
MDWELVKLLIRLVSILVAAARVWCLHLCQHDHSRHGALPEPDEERRQQVLIYPSSKRTFDKVSDMRCAHSGSTNPTTTPIKSSSFRMHVLPRLRRDKQQK